MVPLAVGGRQLCGLWALLVRAHTDLVVNTTIPPTRLFLCVLRYIWAVRNQTYRLPKYDKFMSEVGRAPAEKVALVDKQEEDDKSRIYFQEITVDGLRHSDWLCTLVLMSLDFGHLRQYLNYATAGVIPDMPIKKHWVASLQALMILFASIWRFYLNEGRTYLGTDRKPRELHPCVIGVAWGSLAVSCGIFGVVVWALLDGLPDWSDTFPEHINTDVTCMRVLVLIWVGYPIVAILPRIGHEQLDLPGFEYNAAWSFFKDLGFAFLDVASKAGLAIYFVLKASWVDAATENALVAAGKIALNVTV